MLLSVLGPGRGESWRLVQFQPAPKCPPGLWFSLYRWQHSKIQYLYKNMTKIVLLICIISLCYLFLKNEISVIRKSDPQLTFPSISPIKLMETSQLILGSTGLHQKAVRITSSGPAVMFVLQTHSLILHTLLKERCQLAQHRCPGLWVEEGGCHH